MNTEQNKKIQFSFFEGVLFKYRFFILALSFIITLILGYKATSIYPDTRLERLVPSSHEFVTNAKAILGAVSAADSTMIRVAVTVDKGDIYNYDYFVTLQKVSDELSLMDGVDTGSLQSLWSPGMLWFDITPEGFDSGPIIEIDGFSDSSESIDTIRTNILRADLIGSYVANNNQASMINFRVLPVNAATGELTDFNKLSDDIETIRSEYASQGVSIHVIGDIKKIADLVDGFTQIALFFAAACLITALLLYHYSRCVRSTLVPLACSFVAVIWQLGMLQVFNLSLGVFSVLVPFLIFAIAMSHGVQVINAIAHETAKGESRLNAAKVTFHNLYRPGLIALLSDGIGFTMLFVIDIGAIQDLALVASIGVAIVIISNLIILPLTMSYVGVSQSCITHAQTKLESRNWLWEFIARFSRPLYALPAITVALILGTFAFFLGLDQKIGDLDKGAPELRQDSQYNIDNNYITENFSTSTDLMSVFVKVPKGECGTYKSIDIVDRLDWELSNTPGVQSVDSAADAAKMSRFFGNEGNLKLYSIPRDETVLMRGIERVGNTVLSDFVPENCFHQTVYVELSDHKQETLVQVVSVIKRFAEQNKDQDIEVLLGSGNAAFEAATNEVIQAAQFDILIYIYCVVALLCLLMFRSFEAVLCVILPLALTSLMCQALMSLLGIGVKVATLPVIALGVGIGVDYGIYIYDRLRSYLKLGHNLQEAYLETLKTTGKAVAFTGLTLSVSVAIWMISPIKFQADMGILLTFMFLWNMIGALILIPSLAAILHRQSQKQSQPVALTES
ncbi:RND family transporter [Amphritea sp.]|uniref:efflux RND transporter permease subunit n=1 Tax=Amphritea sp. TaxID=1872502 RepID=UPI0035698BE3